MQNIEQNKQIKFIWIMNKSRSKIKVLQKN